MEYVPFGMESFDDVVGSVCDGIALVLVGCKVKTWPRHRWKGSDIATNQIALCDAVHGLLSWTYPLFVESFGKARPAVALPTPGLVRIAAEPANPADGHGGDGGDDREAGGVERQDDPPGLPGEDLVPGSEDNTRFRAKGVAFVTSRPLGTLVITRLIMEPLRELLDRKLFVGSKSLRRCSSLQLHRQPREVRISTRCRFENLDSAWLQQMFWGTAFHEACSAFKPSDVDLHTTIRCDRGKAGLGFPNGEPKWMHG